MSKKIKPNLYNDLHPDKSLKNTGFKDKPTAIKTINLVKKRSLKYQFDVINTMYNRAKYHPYRTPDMEQAMGIFSKWLKTYKKTDTNPYPFADLKDILPYEKFANEYLIDKTFLSMYKKTGGKPSKLQYVPIDKSKPSGYDYWSYRIKLLDKLTNKLRPTIKDFLQMIMLGYNPFSVLG